MPLNRRNYQDLFQLVGGVAGNRQADSNSDSSVSVLGERGGNILYLIDGFSNQDTLNGGASAQFWQSVAWLFGSSLKQHYNPNDEDAEMEPIVQEVMRMYHDS